MAEALGVAGSAVGIVSLGIQVAQGLLAYYGSWRDQDSDIAELCASAENLSGSLTALRDAIQPPAAFDPGVKSVVEKSVHSANDSIHRLNGELGKVRDAESPKQGARSAMRRHARRALYPFREETLKKIQRDVGEARQNLALVLQVLQIRDVVEIRQAVHKLVRWQEDDETRSILRWLSPRNFWLRQADLLQRRQPGTGQWLLQDPRFLEWAKGDKGTIWCRGGPGVGKTILASAVIEFLETDLPPDQVGLAFVYCNHKESHAQNVQYFTSALVRQLVERRRQIPASVRGVYERHRGKETVPTEAEYAGLLESLSEHLAQVYIVVDALDECVDKQGQHKWIDLLTSLQASVPNLRLLYTSRDIHDTAKTFEDSIVIPIQAKEADVRAYIGGRLQSEGVFRQFCDEDSSLKNEITESVVSKSDGMFLAAQLHLDSLAFKTNRRAVKRALRELPRSLDGNYDDAMERVRNMPTSGVAMRVLAWVVYSVVPLRIEQIQHAIAMDDIEPDDRSVPEDLLTPASMLANSCAGLFRVDEASNIVGLVHKTAQEYFDRTGSHHFPHVHGDIAITCVRYLLLPVFDEGPCSSYALYEQRLRENPLLPYAVGCLREHVDVAGELGPHGLIMELLADERKMLSTAQSALHGDRALFVEDELRTLRGFRGAHCAARLGLKQALRSLIEDFDVGLDDADGAGRTPLSWAADLGHEAIVKMLVKEGADVEAGDEWDQTPLYLAATEGSEAVFKFLVEMGANIEARTKDGWTPLIWAADDGVVTIAELLIRKGADIEARSTDGLTPLLCAAASGHTDVVELLIKKGAKIDREVDGRTPLGMATEHGEVAVVKLLRDQIARAARGKPEGMNVVVVEESSN